MTLHLVLIDDLYVWSVADSALRAAQDALEYWVIDQGGWAAVWASTRTPLVRVRSTNRGADAAWVVKFTATSTRDSPSGDWTKIEQGAADEEHYQVRYLRTDCHQVTFKPYPAAARYPWPDSAIPFLQVLNPTIRSSWLAIPLAGSAQWTEREA